MSLRHAPRSVDMSHASSSSSSGARAVQRRALASTPPTRPLQYKGGGDGSADAHAAAARGVQGSGGKLPHGDAIQKSFGRHDVSKVQAHVGGGAEKANEALGAQAYATGDQVAFKGAPDLHTAAHEAAHVVQQKAGVSLKGGVGESGDTYEQHADQVADAVVQGKSAEPILDKMAGYGGARGGVQRKVVQLKGGGAECPNQADLDAHQGDKSYLGKVEKVQTGETGPWESKHVGEPRDGIDGRRPAQTWSQSPLKWRLEDVKYARKLLGNLDAQAKPKADKDQRKASGPSNASASIDTTKTIEQQKDGTVLGVGDKQKTTTTTTKAKAKGADKSSTTTTTSNTVGAGGVERIEDATKTTTTSSGKGTATTVARVTELGDGDGPLVVKPTTKTEDVEDKPAEPKKMSVKKEGQIYADAVAESGQLEAINKKWDLGGGFTFEYESKLCSYSGSLAGNVGATSDSAKAKGEVKAAANLVEFKAKLEWSYAGEVLKESCQIKGYVNISGSAGADVSAALEGAARSVANAKDKGGNNDVSALASAKGEAFAGAKLGAAAGVRLDWKKKPQKDYQEQLTNSVAALLPAAGAALGPMGWLVGAALGAAGGAEAIAWVLDKVIDWGPDGDVALMLLEVAGDVSAGIGGKAEASAGFEKGKITLKAGASGTIGLGAGMGGSIVLDIVQGPLFILVVAGQLLGEVKDWIVEKIAAAAGDVADLFAAAWNYLDADDKVREAVDNNVHTVVGPKERRQMLDNVLDEWVGGPSEKAAIAIVEASIEKGDVGQVLVGETLRRWNSEISQQTRQALGYHEARVTGKRQWTTVLDGVRYGCSPTLRGGHFIEVEIMPDVTWNAQKTVDANSSRYDARMNSAWNRRAFNIGGTPKDVYMKSTGEDGSVAAAFETREEAEKAAKAPHGVWEN